MFQRIERKEIMNEISDIKTLTHHAKAHLVLDDSDTHTFGVVRDTEGSYTWRTGEGPAVGEWTKSPHDNMYHLFLLTPTEALVDKAVVRLEEMVQKRAAGIVKTTEAVKKPKVVKVDRTPIEHTLAIDFSRLRSKLRRLT